jgi:hypothetical protein
MEVINMIIRQVYNLEALFKQLGLACDPEAIDSFINTHSVESKIKLHEAEFWNNSQRSFLESAFANDDVWTTAMDELNVRLHG